MVPAAAWRFLAGQSAGRTADTASDLEKITGRPATSYAQWAAQHADAYR